MKIAIIGSRGFLADYGGYETFIRYLVAGLEHTNYQFIVYGLSRYHDKNKDSLYPRVKRVWLPTVPFVILRKVLSSWMGVIHACLVGCDIVFAISVTPGPLLVLPKLLGKRIIVNTDGLEWFRPKWSGFISFWLKLCAALACKFGHVLIADSQAIAKYLQTKCHTPIVFVPYGAEDNSQHDDNDLNILAKYNLQSGEYYLQVCRLEPENNAQLVIDEFQQYKGNKQLNIVGDTPHSPQYKANLLSQTNHRIRLLGSIYGEDIKVIMRNSFCYIHGHEAGGTNPVLLEAMASAKCPVVLNVPYNLEVISDCGLSFLKDRGDLLSKILLLEKNGSLVAELGKKAYERARHHYTWERVVSDYDAVFRNLSKT